MNKLTLTLICIISLFASGIADAEILLVDNNITVSTTWTSNNVYNLQKQIYVLPGAL